MRAPFFEAKGRSKRVGSVANAVAGEVREGGGLKVRYDVFLPRVFEVGDVVLVFEDSLDSIDFFGCL